MTDNRNARKRRKKVRASVVRRTVVGSLLVMLSPFLTLLEDDASASVTMRKPVILDSSPAIERSIEGPQHPYASKDKAKSLPLSQRGEVRRVVESGSVFTGIEASLRQEARLYWTYENVVPEAIALRKRVSP